MTHKSFLTTIFIILFTLFNFFITHCDLAEPNQLFIQDPATPMMEGMIYFHNFLMLCMIFVGTFVFYMLFYTMVAFSEKRNAVPQRFSHNSPLEIAWTILPAIILLFIAIPSFTLLYSLDELTDPQITLKIIGHQWYWTYDISDSFYNNRPQSEVFSQYMYTDDVLENMACFKNLRLLMAQPMLMLPIRTHIRLLVTSADVLHSWAVPSFGIKIDACPGRLSQGSLYINRELNKKGYGIFFGQCSEICGVNHGFMPISILSVARERFYLSGITAEPFEMIRRKKS